MLKEFDVKQWCRNGL